MALIRDPKGTTHLVDIFNGGTWCGCDWETDWEPVEGRDPTCVVCNTETSGEQTATGATDEP